MRWWSASTRATPSPISRMMPTLRLIAAVLTPAIWRSRSCKRLAIFSPCRVRKDQAYETVSSEELFERRQATLDAVVVHVAADLDAHAADECGIVAERGHDSLTESLRNSGLDSGLRVGRERGGALDLGAVLLAIQPDGALKAGENRERARTLRVDEPAHHLTNARFVQRFVNQTQLKDLASLALRLFLGLHRSAEASRYVCAIKRRPVPARFPPQAARDPPAAGLCRSPRRSSESPTGRLPVSAGAASPRAPVLPLRALSTGSARPKRPRAAFPARAGACRRRALPR